MSWVIGILVLIGVVLVGNLVLLGRGAGGGSGNRPKKQPPRG
jgi:preprotein translocase subunit SecG